MLMISSFEVEMRIPRDFADDEFGVTPALGVVKNLASAEVAKVHCGPNVFTGDGGNAQCIADPSEEDLKSLKIPLTLKG